MNNLPPIPFPEREIYWKFLGKSAKVSPVSRMKAGRAMKVKGALKRIEEVMNAEKEAKRKKAEILRRTVQGDKGKQR